MEHSDQAFVTLATNDSYCKGALVLAHSLKQTKTRRKLVIIIGAHVSKNARETLKKIFDEVVEVNVLNSNDVAHLALLKRPELGITFTKLHCWNLTQYAKCVFMDADTMVLQNIDELFCREELSASPDSGWPDIFNSGVFVYRPSTKTFQELIEMAAKEGSFDGGDQGLLNMYFNTWAHADIKNHLPFLYNLHVTLSYTYAPAFKSPVPAYLHKNVFDFPAIKVVSLHEDIFRFGGNAKVVHFIGAAKPWNQTQAPTSQGAGFKHYFNRWKDIYHENVKEHLEKNDESSNTFLESPATIYNGNQDNQPKNNIESHNYKNIEIVYSESPHPPSSSFHYTQVNQKESFVSDEHDIILKPHLSDNVSVEHNFVTSHEDHVHVPHDTSSSPPKSKQNNNYFHNQVAECDEESSVETSHELLSFLQDENNNNHLHAELVVHDHEKGKENETIFQGKNAAVLSNSQPTPKHNIELSSPQSSKMSECVAAPQIHNLHENRVLSIADNHSKNVELSHKEETPAEKEVRVKREVQEHRQAWENGSIDYMGRDSFDNILSRINSSLK